MNLTYIPFSYYFRMNYNLKKKKEKSLSVTNISTYTYPFSNFYNNIYLISFLNDYSIKLRYHLNKKFGNSLKQKATSLFEKPYETIHRIKFLGSEGSQLTILDNNFGVHGYNGIAWGAFKGCAVCNVRIA